MIDTQSKRRSVQAYTMGLMRPVPDGAVAVEDRATATWLYSGLTYGGAPAAAASDFYITFARRRARR